MLEASSLLMDELEDKLEIILPEISTIMTVLPLSFGPMPIRLKNASSIISSQPGTSLAAAKNLNGRTLDAFPVVNALRTSGLFTQAFFMLRRFLRSAMYGSLPSSNNLVNASFLSAPPDKATSHVSGVSSSSCLSFLKISDCSLFLGIGCTILRMFLRGSLTPLRLYLA